MIYQIEYDLTAEVDISELKKTNAIAYKKLIKLIKELHHHPRYGTGKPEMLKYGNYKGLWSRRITRKHRLIYSINDNQISVLIVSVQGHYDDK